MKSLREIALRYPEAEEEISDAGTAAERGTVKARDRAFLFFGKHDATLKLGRSVGDATRLAHKEPRHYRMGTHGWVKVTFEEGEPLPLGLLESWIEESYRLVAPKELVALLPASGPPSRRSV